MTFDPEKVERFNFNPGIGCSHSENGVIVKFEDYDQLLTLYRETRALLVARTNEFNQRDLKRNA